jgi:uncharacterized protein (TIGR02145 family)
MFCTKCGTSLPDGTAFCTKCGKPLKKTETSQVNNPKAPSININLNQTQKTETADSFATSRQTCVKPKNQQVPNRTLVSIITLLFGWFGVHNIVWGKKAFGFIQLVIFILAVAIYNENFGLNLITWFFFTSLCGWLIYDSIRILDGEFFNSEKESNNAAIVSIIWYGICALAGLWLIIEGFGNLTMAESDAVYSIDEIEKAFATPYENIEKFKDSKYTIVGIVKGTEGFADIALEVSGNGPIKSVGLDFFQSEKDELQKYTAGLKIKAYCIGRGLEDGKFTAEYCLLKGKFNPSETKSSNVNSTNKSTAQMVEKEKPKKDVQSPVNEIAKKPVDNPPNGTFVDERDKKTYKYITIGKLIWMAENLNFKTEDSWCYDDKNVSCKKYGRLYTYDAAMKACPDGWHLPSMKEWKYLFSVVEGTNIDDVLFVKSKAAQKLKSTSGWAEGWDDNGKRSGNGDDAYGFAALPAGTRTIHDDFNALGEYAFFWTSTEYHTAYDPKYTRLDDTEGLSKHASHISFVNKSDWPNYAQYGVKSLGHSVRCVKNFNK